MKTKTFETNTRTSALEIVTTLAEEMPSLLRKRAGEIKEELFPAIFQMICEPELEDDLEEWINKTDEEEDIAKNDPSSVAKTSLDRIATAIGEKVALGGMQMLITGSVQSEIWQHRMGGYICVGQISNPCKKAFLSNIQEIMGLPSKGLMDQNVRVRYEAITSLGLLLTELAPDAQEKFHVELLPALINLATTEEHVKL
jgi:hypothetical protein